MYVFTPQVDTTSGVPDDKPPSSPSEVFSTALRAADMAGLLGRERALEAAADRVNDTIFKATGERIENPMRVYNFETPGADIAPLRDPFAVDAWDRRRRELAERYPKYRDAIQPDVSLAQLGATETQRALADADDAWERAPSSPMTYAAYGAASVASVAKDPLAWATGPLFPAGRAAAGAAGVAWQALKMGAANAALTAVEQPFIQAWRKEAGLDYGVATAAEEVAASFLMGAGLEGGIRGGWRLLRKAQGKVPTIDADGMVTGYRSPGAPDAPSPAAVSDPLQALDDAAIAAPEGALIRRAQAGDLDALEALAEKTGLMEEPEVRAAMEIARRETSDRAPPARVADFDHVQRYNDAMRAAVDPRALPQGHALVHATEVTASPERIAEVFQQDPVALAADIRETPDLLQEGLPWTDPQLRAAAHLSRLSDSAFDMVAGGEAHPMLGAVVAEHVADADRHTGLLRALTDADPRTQQQARSALADLLAEPRDDVTHARLAGVDGDLVRRPVTLVDDPYGRDGFIHLEQLRSEHAAEIEAATGVKPETSLLPKQQPRPSHGRLADALDQALDQALARTIGRLPEGVTAKSFREISDLPEHLAHAVRRAQSAGLPVDALTDRQSGNIWIAFDAVNPDGTLSHETIHALRQTGLLTDREMRILAAKADTLPEFFDAGRRVAYEQGYADLQPALFKEAMLQEKVAHLYEARANGANLGKAANEIVRKISQFIERVRNALRGLGWQSAEDIMAGIDAGDVARRAPQADAAPGSALFALRTRGIAKEAGEPLSTFNSDKEMKAHPLYAAAKGGDRDAAARLVSDLVRPEDLARAGERFGRDVVYVPVIAEEATGRNKIPEALANYYAASTGASISDAIVQSNRAFHTGARPLERLIAQAVFHGEVERGRAYVLVDDVTMLGGTLADLAHHIQENGGEVAGIVTLVNAGRSDVGKFRGNAAKEIEARYGDTVRQEFGIDPAALTPGEQAYILNFRDADALRAGIAKARSERDQRLLSKGIRPPEAEDGEVGGGGALFSLRDDSRKILKADLDEAKAIQDAKARAQRERQALLDEGIRKKNDRFVTTLRDARGQVDPAKAIIHLLESHGEVDLPAGMTSVAAEQKAVEAMLKAQMEDVLHTFRPQLVTGKTRETARLHNVVREMAGEGTGDDAAKALAQSALAVMERARQMFNAAGGAIAKLEGWFLPQVHNRAALLAAGKTKWTADIMRGLDTGRILDGETRRPLSHAEITKALGDIWENITSDGHGTQAGNAADPFGGVTGDPRGAKKIANRRQEHRFLHFKSADAWLEYQKQYGGGADPFRAVMEHLTSISKDIAAMRVLGTNPSRELARLSAFAMKQAALTRPARVLIDEAVAKVKDIAGRYLAAPTRLNEVSERIGGIHKEIVALREKNLGRLSHRNRKKIEALRDELFRLDAERLSLMERGQPRVDGLEGAHIRAELSAAYDELGAIQDVDKVLFPKRTEVLGKTMTRRGFWTTDPEDYARSYINRAEAMWDLYRGVTSAPVNVKAAEYMQMARNVGVIGRGGSMVISSIADNFTQVMARRFAGLPAHKAFTDIMAQLGPDARREAHRQALIGETYLHMFNDGARAAASLHGPQWSQVLAERTIALQGLGALTDAQRQGFGMSLRAAFADLASKTWAELGALNPRLQKVLKRYGIDAADWDALRLDGATGRPREVDFLSPNLVRDDLERHDAAGAARRVAERYLGMILQETDFASPTAMLRARSAMVGKSRPGTLVGELLRTGGQFKSFAVMFWMLHAERALREGIARGALKGASYAGQVLFVTMLGGAMVRQMKDFKGGKDLLPMDRPAFWYAAMLQGGGLGIWGDLLNAEQNRFGGGLVSTLSGPVVGIAEDVLGAAGLSSKTTARRGTARLLTSYVPGTSLWYTNLAWQRIAAESLQRQLDPHAYDAFRRRQQSQMRDYGNGFWWAPGDRAPRRGPDFSGAMGR